MRAISLLYHDVINNGNYDTSGFRGSAAARYKLKSDEFEAHCQAIANALSATSIQVYDAVPTQQAASRLLLTFDDGGASATHVADILERYGWHGHFFITTSCIGQNAFVSESQIRALRDRGHAVGTHSCSHPERMSYLTWDKMVEEWSTSIQTLSQILGEQVTIASVPGGYYSQKVAESAAFNGIKTLFTSEPITRCRVVQECVVLGRYTIWRGMDPEVSAGFASGRVVPRVKQWVFWNSKKCAKVLAGPLYSNVRKYLAEHVNS